MGCLLLGGLLCIFYKNAMHLFTWLVPPLRHVQTYPTSRIMFPEYILAAAAILKGAAACPDHTGSQSVGSLQRRATESASQDWAYETSFDWGFANPSTARPPTPSRLPNTMAKE